MYRLYATLCACLLLTFTAEVSAQISNSKLAEINRVAMEAYNNLDIETAKKMLEEAVKSAERAGTHGAAMARTYSNLGVVVVGGMGDSSSGVELFTKALREDPNVEPDPIVATPEIMVAFASAKKKGGGGRASAAAASSSGGGGSVEGNLSHEPAAEQLSQTAVPVFVARAGLKANNVKIFYRSLGMSKPKSAKMSASTAGWSYLIPCADVFEPSVEYFIVAEDDDGDQVGNAGTPENPVAVPIVSTRTQEAPSLPGQDPPTQCGTAGTVEECPPGLPGCRTGSAQLGDTCRSNSDCASGLSCVDDFCSMGEADDSPRKRDKGGAPRWFLDIGAGAGFIYVGQGATADRQPPKAFVQNALDVQTATTSEEAGREALARNGWTCDWKSNPALPGSMIASNCKVTVETKGMVPVPMLTLAAGYYVTPKLGLGVTARVQFDSGSGILAGAIVGARLEYVLTQPKPKGLHVGAALGVGLGTLQAKPPTKKTGPKPYATSAPPGGLGIGVSVGLRVGYRFNRYIGLQAFPGVTIGLPRTLFALDVSGGVVLSY